MTRDFAEHLRLGVTRIHQKLAGHGHPLRSRFSRLEWGRSGGSGWDRVSAFGTGMRTHNRGSDNRNPVGCTRFKAELETKSTVQLFSRAHSAMLVLTYPVYRHPTVKTLDRVSGSVSLGETLGAHLTFFGAPTFLSALALSRTKRRTRMSALHLARVLRVGRR